MSVQRWECTREMARDDGEWVEWRDHERAVAEAVAAEREACAQAIEQYADERLVKTQRPNMSEDITAALRTAATRIRARGDHA